MAEWIQKPNSGSIWKNDDRKTDQHPNMTGSGVIDGVDYWISAWTKETKEGKRYQSLSFKPKEVTSQRKEATPPPRRTQAEIGREVEAMEDDIPF